MFTLSSADLHIPPKSDREINIPIRFQSSDEKFSKERITHDIAASCDDDGHVFVYDPSPNHIPEESSSKLNFFLSKIESISLVFQFYFQEKLIVYNNGYPHVKQKKKYQYHIILVQKVN